MKIYQEIDLTDFDFWSGAKANAEMLNYDELKWIEHELDEIYPDGIDATELNDLFWFEFEWICELADIKYDVDKDEIIR